MYIGIALQYIIGSRPTYKYLATYLCLDWIWSSLCLIFFSFSGFIFYCVFTVSSSPVPCGIPSTFISKSKLHQINEISSVYYATNNFKLVLQKSIINILLIFLKNSLHKAKLIKKIVIHKTWKTYFYSFRKKYNT